MAIRNQTQVLASQGLVKKGWNVIVREELGYKDTPAPKDIETVNSFSQNKEILICSDNLIKHSER